MVIDRGIGIAGLALAVIFGALQYFQLEVATWVSVSGVGIMLGLSVGSFGPAVEVHYRRQR
jgi:hypothetical protein